MANRRAPGRDAIDGVLAGLYGDDEPLHADAAGAAGSTGAGVLEQISAYPRIEPVPHWHLISYGMTELYEKTSDNHRHSGCGFEFTLRVARAPTEIEPPTWALNLLRYLAEHQAEIDAWWSSRPVRLGGPIAPNLDTQLRAVMFVGDPELPWIETVHGDLGFLQVVGLTLDEVQAAELWSVASFEKLFATKFPLYVTEPSRASALADPEFAAAAAAGSAEHGSYTNRLVMDVRWSVVDGAAVVTVGAADVDSLRRMIQARLPYDRSLLVAGPTHRIRFVPGTSFRVREYPAHQPDKPYHHLALRVPQAAVATLADVLYPETGDHPVPGLPLTVHIERSETRSGGTGEIVDTVG
ncbi:suppressor of fused domain protein [Actinocatenispora sera]|uniref:suppressor of fused domain protein n=1 Tax=Actinocatenispora sera TaxID=390989 RepID=UPI0033FCF703